jgi:UDP-N-acetylglucosamine--N-acetylmuramyl-(pentapeptide) pyrophosphoryl-undecaprenol N-acetylglucosamine transferase
MKILMATGGSGGHIFPALQTALELRKRGHDVIFAGVLDLAEDKLKGLGFSCYNTGAEGFKDKSLQGMAKFGTSMTKAVLESRKILRQVKPDKVVGFGGYGSFPVLLAASMAGCPSMIHEQNVKPGKANQVLAGLVKKVGVGFKSGAAYFGRKAVWVGCPCHNAPPDRSIEDIKTSFGFKPDSKVIALLGGSQGSIHLNKVFSEAMQVLCKDGVVGIHMTGKSEHEKYAMQYKNLGLPVVALPFISPIEELYAITDVMVTRCGAATVSELGAFCVPSVLVPYPFAGNHQKYNGEVLSHAGAAVLVEQKDLNADVLIGAVHRLNASEFSRLRIAQKTKGLFALDAAKRLAEVVEQL